MESHARGLTSVPTQSFIIEGKFLGTAQRSPGACSQAFYCYECGKVWAVCPLDGPTPAVTKWRYDAGLCRACGTRHAYTLVIPGSIYQPYPDPEFVRVFPSAVLSWEVDRHFDHYDKWKALQP